jgi:hypothetical protein
MGVTPLVHTFDYLGSSYGWYHSSHDSQLLYLGDHQYVANVNIDSKNQ